MCKLFLCLSAELIRKHKCSRDDLDFLGFINFCVVDSDGYPMLAHEATAVTNGLCSKTKSSRDCLLVINSSPNTRSKPGQKLSNGV